MRRLVPLLLAALLAAAAASAADAPAQPPRAARSARTAALESPFLTPERVGGAKAAIALAGAALLAWGAAPRRAPPSPRERRLRDGLLLGLGGAAALGWWNFLAFHHPGYGHPSDTFHYYVGSKYFRELGYERLYLCTALADLEAGLGAQLERRYLRDLSTNELTTASAVLAHAQACRDAFSPARWAAFSRDVAWFRLQVPPRRWQRMQTDHGYNATPVWTALGGSLANRVPATRSGILALRLLDPLLLALSWIAVARAFGWRAACVALLYWGTNHPAQFGWTGGSFLRQGWLAASVTALCALRGGRPAAAGALFGAAIALRIFPAFIALAFAIQALARMARLRRLELARDHRRLLAGALASLAALIAFSFAAGGGAPAWQAFVANSRTHLATPLRNSVGLATVVSYVPSAAPARDPASEDPYASWKQAKRQAAESRRWLFASLLGGYALLLARVALREPDWVVGVLGLGLVTLAADLTCYYSAGLLGFGLLWLRRESIGVALCLLAASGWWIADTGRPLDEVFTGISLASVLFVLFATLQLARRGAGCGAEAR